MRKMEQAQIPKTLQVVVTGYGPFMNVLENPSADLQKEILKEFENRFGSNSGIQLFHGEVLVVHSKDVNTFLEQLDELITKHQETHPRDRFLIVHLGVNGGLRELELQIESKCYNCTNFNDGNVYVPGLQMEIDKQKKLDESLNSTLPLDEIHEILTTKHPHIKISEDPGRYLCNYI